MELMNDCRHDVQNLGLSSVGHVASIVYKDRLQKGRNHAIVDHLQVIRFLNVGVDEFQDFLLDGSQTADFGGLRGNVSYGKTRM